MRDFQFWKAYKKTNMQRRRQEEIVNCNERAAHQVSEKKQLMKKMKKDKQRGKNLSMRINNCESMWKIENEIKTEL